jgi:hypothetical protein
MLILDNKMNNRMRVYMDQNKKMNLEKKNLFFNWNLIIF